MLRLPGIAPDLVHTARPNFSMIALMYSESRVAKLHPLILFIPTPTSTFRVPRGLLQTQSPVKRKARPPSSSLSLSISCAASRRILSKAASSGERARVRGVVGAVGAVGAVVVLYLFEALVEGGCGGSGSGWDESPAFLIGFACRGWRASVCSGH